MSELSALVEKIKGGDMTRYVLLCSCGQTFVEYALDEDFSTQCPVCKLTGNPNDEFIVKQTDEETF